LSYALAAATLPAVPLVAGARRTLEVTVRITILTNRVLLDEHLRAYIQRRLRFALDRFGAQIGTVAVRLADLNGPRGGIDKRCAVSVNLPACSHVHVTQLDRSLYAAVDLAVERAAEAVASCLARRRDLRTAG